MRTLVSLEIGFPQILTEYVLFGLVLKVSNDLLIQRCLLLIIFPFNRIRLIGYGVMYEKNAVLFSRCLHHLFITPC